MSYGSDLGSSTGVSDSEAGTHCPVGICLWMFEGRRIHAESDSEEGTSERGFGGPPSKRGRTTAGGWRIRLKRGGCIKIGGWLKVEELYTVGGRLKTA